MKNLKNILYNNLKPQGKNVIIRTCLNLPRDKKGKVTDETRLLAAVPLIKEMASQAKAVILIAHFDRPKKPDPNLSLKNLLPDLEKELGTSVNFAPSPSSINKQEAKGVILVENIRFFPEEKSKKPGVQEKFAKDLASLGDAFINDSFPDYRKSASTYHLARELPSFIGPAFYKEIKALENFRTPQRPYLAILAGAKDSKFDTMAAIAKKADKLLLGGPLAFTLMKADGIPTGKSVIISERFEQAKICLKKFRPKFVFPQDHLTVDKFEEPKDSNKTKITPGLGIPENRIAIDIGPKTINLFQEEIRKAKSIIWNGPVGIYEWKAGQKGTKEIAKAMVDNEPAYTLTGGGDSVSAINEYGIKKFDHVSTGGGAMLAYLAGEEFPTLEVLIYKQFPNYNFH